MHKNGLGCVKACMHIYLNDADVADDDDDDDDGVENDV